MTIEASTNNNTTALTNHSQARSAIVDALGVAGITSAPMEGARAIQNEYLGNLAEGLKEAIMARGDLPTSVKDAALNIIDGMTANMSDKVRPSVQEAVAKTEEGKQAAEAGQADAKSAAEMSAATARSSGETEESGKGGKSRSWLVALAEQLGKMQGRFMDDAMANLAEMENNVEGVREGISNAGGDTQLETPGAAEAFTVAQNKFSANMQMFSMMTNASSTAIKTVGEGLSALARKQ